MPRKSTSGRHILTGDFLYRQFYFEAFFFSPNQEINKNVILI